MKTLNVTSVENSVKEIPVIFHRSGLGFLCESVEVEGIAGRGETKAKAIEAFIVSYLLRFDEVVEVSIKE
jgi:hypothetical protein